MCEGLLPAMPDMFVHRKHDRRQGWCVHLQHVVPWVRDQMASPSWQLADAHSKIKLAEAMRRGDVGRMKSLMMRIEQSQMRATNPSDDRRSR